MKNKNLWIAAGLIGGVYAIWRFVIKDKIAEKQATKSLNNRILFDANRELIAQTIPQEIPGENEIIDIDFENIT